MIEKLFSKKMKVVNISLIVVTILFCSFVFLEYQSIVRVLLLIFFIILCVDALRDFRKKYVYLFFYLTFFIFTMGQYVFVLNNEVLNYTDFSSKVNITTMVIQYLSLLTIYLGGLFYDSFKHKLWRSKDHTSIQLTKNQYSCIYLFLIILFIISIIVNVEMGIYVFKEGYLSLYDGGFHSIFPNYIRYLSDFFPLMCFICLPIFRSKKNILIILLLYFIYLCFTLMTGVRGEFGIGIMMIMICLFIYYFIIWRSTFHINKKRLIILISIASTLAIVVFSGLNIMNTSRNKQTLNDKNILHQFNDFFVNQSNSLNLISIAQTQKKSFDKIETLYTFGPVLKNVESKIQKIDNDFKFTWLSNKHTSFGIDVSKISLGEEMYSKGHGLGSQYFAELYIDYGFIGIIIYNFLLGILLACLSRIHTFGVFGFSFSLLLLQSILYLPRNEALQFLNTAMSFNYWILLCVVILLIYYKKIYKFFFHNKVRGSSND